MSAHDKKFISGNNIDMIDRNQLVHELLSGITESELKQLVNLRKNMRPRTVPRTKNQVKQMVHGYEENIIPPPLKFRVGYKLIH